jgi:hypothetical protein
MAGISYHRRADALITSFAATLFFSLAGGGCDCTFYSNGDSPALLDRLGGVELTTTAEVSLPVAESRCLFNPPPPRDRATLVELSAGTRLRVFHFETAKEDAAFVAVAYPVTVQAQVASGRHAGQRVVVGQVHYTNDGACIGTMNVAQGLSSEAGDRLEVVDPMNRRLLFHYHLGPATLPTTSPVR